MALASVNCRTQLGLSAPLVRVEVSVGPGLPGFALVGLPDTVVKESKERVRASIRHSKYEFPAARITVNLSPADLPKDGGWFDLPIAVGILLASEQLRPRKAGRERLARCELYGELALSGELKATRGLLIAAAHAAQTGHEIIVPSVNFDEARRAPGVVVWGAAHLRDVCAHLEGKRLLEGLPALAADAPAAKARSDDLLDLRDIRGQSHAKRALMIAAAGGHCLLYVGVPGSGKSTLARRLPSLLPPLTEAEALEVAAVASASAAGFDARTFGIRPFRAPHHTASAVSIIGGGSHARPGEISLAHHGVLFLDELPEFERRVLEALREPLETGEVAISRLARQAQYPAAFQLIAAMNPCPCGYGGDERGLCHCTTEIVERYRRRISGPLLDRLDLQIAVPRVATWELLETLGPDEGECTATAATAVSRARETQIRRQGVCNARLAAPAVTRYCAPDRPGRTLIERAADQQGLSARGYHRVLKVARTIADLAGEECLQETHVAEAISMRMLDKRTTVLAARARG